MFSTSSTLISSNLRTENILVKLRYIEDDLHCQHRHRIHRSYQGAKEEGLEQSRISTVSFRDIEGSLSDLVIQWAGGVLVEYLALLRCSRPEQPRHPDQVEEASDGEHVEDGAHHGHEQYGAELVKEQSVGHEVPGLSNDGRQQEQEEDVRGQGGGSLVLRGHEEEEYPDDNAADDEDTGLGQELVDIGGFVESWKEQHVI